MNLSTLAVAGLVAWKTHQPVVVRDTVLLPAVGFVGLIALWWY
ncbi:MAG: nitrate ABC transporter, permease protein, partial [Hydrococcus sp. CSU_1_8]|nr:nitrate ABC transporter, permease protein [Hydrococcus sp. CSU_1_8]